jgi:hypothetical protein
MRPSERWWAEWADSVEDRLNDLTATNRSLRAVLKYEGHEMADLNTAVGDLANVTTLLEGELTNLKNQLTAAEKVDPGVQSAADAIEGHIASLREAVNSVDPGVLAVPVGQTVAAGSSLIAGSAGQAGQNPGTGSVNPAVPAADSNAAAASVVTTGGGGVPIGATAVLENPNAPVNTPTQEQTQAQSVTDPGSKQAGPADAGTFTGNAAGTDTPATPVQAGTGASSGTDAAAVGTPTDTATTTAATSPSEAAATPAKS